MDREESSHQDPNGSSSSHGGSDRTPQSRIRWRPKPEQILLLESIFNSGLLNPSKDETTQIRKLLQPFGNVCDANIFYWFQNRRSRSRRLERKLQANNLDSATKREQPQPPQPQPPQPPQPQPQPQPPQPQPQPPPQPQAQLQPQQSHSNMLHELSCVGDGGGGAIQYSFELMNNSTTGLMSQFGSSSSSIDFLAGSSSSSSSSSPSWVGGEHDKSLFSLSSGQMISFHQEHQHQAPVMHSALQYESGLIRVFINGVATEVPRGGIDMKAMFGEDVVLIHSSGFIMPLNEFGFLTHSFQQGEHYFLVPRAT